MTATKRPSWAERNRQNEIVLLKRRVLSLRYAVERGEWVDAAALLVEAERQLAQLETTSQGVHDAKSGAACNGRAALEENESAV